MTRTSSLAMRRYSIEPRQENMLKNMDFYRLQKYIYIKKQLLERELDYLKNVPKNVVHKISEFIENKIADAVTKSKNDTTVKQEPVEEIIIPLEKRDETLNGLRQVLL